MQTRLLEKSQLKEKLRRGHSHSGRIKILAIGMPHLIIHLIHFSQQLFLKNKQIIEAVCVSINVFSNREVMSSATMFLSKATVSAFSKHSISWIYFLNINNYLLKARQKIGSLLKISFIHISLDFSFIFRPLTESQLQHFSQ